MLAVIGICAGGVWWFAWETPLGTPWGLLVSVVSILVTWYVSDLSTIVEHDLLLLQDLYPSECEKAQGIFSCNPFLRNHLDKVIAQERKLTRKELCLAEAFLVAERNRKACLSLYRQETI